MFGSNSDVDEEMGASANVVPPLLLRIQWICTQYQLQSLQHICCQLRTAEWVETTTTRCEAGIWPFKRPAAKELMLEQEPLSGFVMISFVSSPATISSRPRSTFAQCLMTNAWLILFKEAFWFGAF